MRLTILTCVLAFCAVFAADVRAQLDPPTATCVEVLADGTAIVNWLPPADPAGEFTSYDIVYSTDYFTADPGTQLFSEATYAVTSYTDMAVDFNNDIGAYYLETNSNDGTAQVSVPSDTICGIHLTLNVLGGGGIAFPFLCRVHAPLPVVRIRRFGQRLVHVRRLLVGGKRSRERRERRRLCGVGGAELADLLLRVARAPDQRLVGDDHGPA